LLLVLAASAQVAHAQAASSAERAAQVENATATATAQAVPTVQILRPTPVTVPTVTVLQPPSHVAKPKHKAKPKLKPTRSTSVAAVNGQWITAFLTSYCPGSAGWLSSSGHSVFYGMLANNYYAFGTRVYMPVIGMTGVVEDHMGYGSAWNQFDVWSPVCYSTPTGYFRVAVLTGSR
jgi:hypothetical protein